MKKYFADTNFYLRFLLKDNQEQANQAEEEIKKAQNGQKKIIFLSFVLLEMNFVLKSVYSLSHSDISDYLLTLVKTPYLDIEDRAIWFQALDIYAKKKISLLDVFLFEKAKAENGEVLSFDKSLKKLK